MLMEWLERKIASSWYQQTAERYYEANGTTTSLYFELTDSVALVYDGWNYKRGMRSRLEMSEFARRRFDADKLRTELASMICFIRRARRMYGWNVIPVVNGQELVLR